MLPKLNCLKKKKDFSAVFKKGKKNTGNFLYIKFLENKKENSRFGIIVSKKVEKKAVLRNKLKRRTRAIIREILPKIKSNIDCVIVFFSVPKKFIFLKKEIEILFEKSKTLYD